jgi:hypothetical protein
MKDKLFWTSIFLIAVCVAWLYPFICIFKYGGYVAQEPNLTILILELGLFIFFIIYAVKNIINLKP